MGLPAAGLFAAVSELNDRATGLARWLIARAVAKLPIDAQERYREEWIAHLNDCDGNIGRFFHAIGVYVTVQRLSCELCPKGVSDESEFGLNGAFKNPKKLRLMIKGTILMLIGTLPDGILRLAAGDLPTLAQVCLLASLLMIIGGAIVSLRVSIKLLRKLESSS
jgi:hypothetical protein